MKMRSLGRTGIQVSEVGFGSLALGGEAYGPVTEDVAKAAVRRALELGCRLFDTADIYGTGRSERILGEVLEEAGPEVIIATKAGKSGERGYDPARIREALDGSLERLRRSRVDVFFLDDPPVEVLMDPALHELAEELKRESKIRAAGVSVVSVANGMAAARSGPWEVIEVEANLLRPEAVKELIPLAGKLGKGVVIKAPLDRGILSGKHGAVGDFDPADVRTNLPPEDFGWRIRAIEELRFLTEGTGRTLAQAALRFLLDEPGVASVLPGIKTPEQAEEALAASEVPRFSPTERQRVRELQSDDPWPQL